MSGAGGRQGASPRAGRTVPVAGLRRRLVRDWPMIAWLSFVWVALWGSISWANVLGGLAVASALVGLLPMTDVETERVVRPVALLRFGGAFLVDLVTSSLSVVAVVLRPRLRLRPAVLALPVRHASGGLLTLLADAISLTPGTLTLEVDRPRSTLYIHVLDVGLASDGLERVRAQLRHQELLATEAVGSPACRQALAEDFPGVGRQGRRGAERRARRGPDHGAGGSR